MVVQVCNPSYSGYGGRKIMSLRLAQAKLVTPCLKNKVPTKELGQWLK
jgi:hypothetical protein